MLNKIIDLSNTPKFPGVYKMINSENTIIYIGKAKNLFNRLKSYTQKNLDIKTKTMTSLVEKIETIVTKTEFEAILLELYLIKQYKPKYNIIEKDNKSNCYIEIETKNEFPSIKTTRRPNEENLLMGPFIKKQHASKIIQTIRPIFKIRDCSDLIFKSRKKPCIEYEIGRCSAPCVNLISKEEYQRDIKKIESIFKNNNTKPIEKEIKQKMNFFIEKEEYQKAKDENDKLKLLINIKNTKKLKDFDMICIKKIDEFFVVSFVIFRYGIKTETISNIFKVCDFFDNFEKFVENFYQNRDIPKQIIVNKPMEFFSFPHKQQI